MTGAPLRVAVFNDSPTMLAAIRVALTMDADIEVVAERPDATDALTVLAACEADVVVMDVVMPGIDGFEATRAIMRERPSPIVMVSSVVDPKDREVVFAALEAGALHIAEPPPAPGTEDYAIKAAGFRELVRTIAGARFRTGDRPASPSAPRVVDAPSRIDAVGVVSSAGGPQALLGFLPGLSDDGPPVLLVQHLASGFTESFAEWLATSCRRRTEVAVHQAPAVPGTVYVAPDGHHLWLDGDRRFVVRKSPPIKGFRPSGDLLLSKLAETLGPAAVGVILSGMGQDGAQGAKALHDSGGTVLAQADAVIGSMPDAAVATGGVKARLSPADLAQWLQSRGARS